MIKGERYCLLRDWSRYSRCYLKPWRLVGGILVLAGICSFSFKNIFWLSLLLMFSGILILDRQVKVRKKKKGTDNFSFL